MREWPIVRALVRALSPIGDNRGSWWPIVREPFTGAWQRNIEWTVDSVLSHPTVFACVTLIASDVAKMDSMLVEEIAPRLWVPTYSPSFSPVLQEPNHFQTEAQFKHAWTTSRAMHGNAYILQERDGRGGADRDKGNVRAQYVLDPSRVKPLVAPDGSVFYEISRDDLSGVHEDEIVPASEIIHDRINCLFHPLVGISPLFASGPAATVGLRITSNATQFFSNDSTPPGILTAPGVITQAQADAMTERWHQRALGKIAVLGSGLTYEPLRHSAVESQQNEQSKYVDEAICRAFRVPPFMIGVGPPSSVQNVESETRKYLTTCLQDYVHNFEKCMDRGLGLMKNIEGRRLGVELDKSALLQMDTATQYRTLAEGVRGGFMAPNEARQKIDLPPLLGGDTVYLQHQDYPIEALYDRVLKEPAAQQAPAIAPAPDVKALPPGRDEDKDNKERAARVSMRTRTLRIKLAA